MTAQHNKDLHVLCQIRINRIVIFTLLHWGYVTHVDVKTTCNSRFQYKPSMFCVACWFEKHFFREREEQCGSFRLNYCWYYEHTALIQPVGLTYWTTWRLIFPEQPRQLYGTGTFRQLKVGCQSRKLSLVTMRSCKTPNHYQKDEMLLWQTRKMRHQDIVEGVPYGRLTLMSNKPPR